MMKKLDKDLEHILQETSDVVEALRDKTIFVTGGTGFFGIWIQLSFAYINAKLGLNAKMIVLTRNENAFLSKNPSVSCESISFLRGDVCSFPFPEDDIHFIIHAATEASVKLSREAPLKMFDTIVTGTRRMLEFATEKNVESFLLTSSGAVYGTQPDKIKNVCENYEGSPDPLAAENIYGEGKRMAEMLSAIYFKYNSLPVKIARCFAFIGPFLPLDTHFAAGNFINNILKGEDIHINGDGSPFRSYMYASDLMIWLWRILIAGGNNRAYNVGSDEPVSIEALAYEIIRQRIEPDTKVVIAEARSDKSPLRYVPCIARAKEELNLKISVGLKEAITKTIEFYTD